MPIAQGYRWVFCFALMGLLLVGLAELASAQVAAPALNPYTFVTENPAVMQWGTPSRIGASYSQAQVVSDPPNVTDNFTGFGAGGRYVGPVFSAALDYSRSDSSNTPYNTGSEYLETAEVALGVRLGDRLALGIGDQGSVQRIPGPFKETHDTPQGGLSIRLGEWFFLGGAAGTDTYKHEDLTTPANNTNTSRDVYKYGVGIRTAGSVLTHFEYYVVDNSKYADQNVPNGRENSRTGVAELNFGGFLIGYSATHTERDVNVPTTDLDRAEIGWAPPTGLTLVVLGTIRKDNQPTGSALNSVTTTAYSLALTYLFSGAK